MITKDQIIEIVRIHVGTNYHIDYAAIAKDIYEAVEADYKMRQGGIAIVEEGRNMNGVGRYLCPVCGEPHIIAFNAVKQCNFNYCPKCGIGLNPVPRGIPIKSVAVE